MEIIQESSGLVRRCRVHPDERRGARDCPLRAEEDPVFVVDAAVGHGDVWVYEFAGVCAVRIVPDP